MSKLAKEWGGFPPPEAQLTGAMIAGPLLVIGCFWLGWTGEYSYIPWYVPVLSTVAIGCSVSLIFTSLMVSYSFLFVELVLTPSPELLNGHVFVSFCARTLSLDFNFPQECILRPPMPLLRCSVVPSVLRSLYSPQRCSERSVRRSIPPGRVLIGIDSWG